MIVVASLLRHDGDIAGLIKFGGAPGARLITDHVEAELGRSIAVEARGTTGSTSFPGLDPLFLDGEHAAHLDRPLPGPAHAVPDDRRRIRSDAG